MTKKTQPKKLKEDQFKKQLRRNQIIFGVVAVLLILSMGLSMMINI